MKKKYLFLGLSLLLCGGSAWAQTTATTTKNIGSYDELSAAITGINNAATLKTKIAQLIEDTVVSYRNKPTIQYEYETKTTSEVNTAILAFYNAISAASSTDDTQISYTIGTQTESKIKEDANGDPEIGDDGEFVYVDVDTYTIYVSIPSISTKISTEDKTSKGLTDWYSFSIKDAVTASQGVTDEAKSTRSLFRFYKNRQTINNDKKEYALYPNYIVLVYQTEDNSIRYTSPFDISTLAKTDRIYIYTRNLVTKLNAASKEAMNEAEGYTRTQTVIKQIYNPETQKWENMESSGYTSWKEEHSTKKEALSTAQNQLGEYATITTLDITGDIKVPAENALVDQTWPAGYTIEGNYHTVTGTDTGKNPLFKANNGTINDWVALDGRIAITNSGNVDNCIVRAAEGYRVYTENSYTNAGTDIKDAVYQKRETFGYDLTKGTIGEKNATNKLYKASYASAANKTKQSFYVNIDKDNDITGENLSAYPTENVFIYVEDKDVPEIETVNVVANGVCKNAEIVDGYKKDEEGKSVKTADFYIPTDFKVEKLKYARDLKTDVATVCMPFAFTDDVKEQINKNLSNNNKVYYYSLREVNQSTQTIWFGYKSSIDANDPAVLAFTENCVPGTIFDGLTNLEFKSTEGATLGLAATNDAVDTKKRFRGNYKADQTSDDLAETATKYEPGMGSGIFGFNNGKLVEMNKDKGRMHQFRSFVVFQTDLTRPNEISAFRIGFMDEEGNEVTHIKNVNTDRNEDNGFKVSGSNGAIEISTDKACDVKVYTTGGALVKAVRVEAGQTSLPVNAGMYIVNKNKVVVK